MARPEGAGVDRWRENFCRALAGRGIHVVRRPVLVDAIARTATRATTSP